MVEDEQQFCLKWNNYSSNMTSVFKELLENEQLCDVTLTAQDQTIKAHRLILTACSGFFKKAFSSVQPWQQPVVFLKDMKYADLKGIIEFIYNGEVSIDQGALTSFLIAAESLKIKGLTEESQRPPHQNGADEFTKIKTNKETINGLKTEDLLGALAVSPPAMRHLSNPAPEVTGAQMDAIKNGVTPPPTVIDEQSFEDDLDDDEMTEDEIKEQQAMYETDGSLPLQLPPGMTPAEMGLKKTCPYCFQKLSWHALSRHIRDMHKAKSDMVNCKYCGKPFRNKNSLGCHIWRFHKRGRESTPRVADSPVALQAATASIS